MDTPTNSLEARLRALEERLESIETRLGRAERLGYVAFADVRDVARYAYENVLLEKTSDTIKKLSGMEQLQDQEVLEAGASAAELLAFKMSPRVIAAQCRRDAVEVAQLIAEMISEAIKANRSEATSRRRVA